MRNRKDLLAGLLIGGFGIFVLYGASRLPYRSEFGPGPGFLPLWLGLGIISFAIVLVASTFLVPGASAQVSWSVSRPLAAWFGLVIAIGLLGRLGFVLSFSLLSLFLVLGMERRSALVAFNVAASLALAFYIIFVFSLGVPLPSGPWGF